MESFWLQDVIILAVYYIIVQRDRIAAFLRYIQKSGLHFSTSKLFKNILHVLLVSLKCAAIVLVILICYEASMLFFPILALPYEFAGKVSSALLYGDITDVFAGIILFSMFFSIPVYIIFWSDVLRQAYHITDNRFRPAPVIRAAAANTAKESSKILVALFLWSTYFASSFLGTFLHISNIKVHEIARSIIDGTCPVGDLALLAGQVSDIGELKDMAFVYVIAFLISVAILIYKKQNRFLIAGYIIAVLAIFTVYIQHTVEATDVFRPLVVAWGRREIHDSITSEYTYNSLLNVYKQGLVGAPLLSLVSFIYSYYCTGLLFTRHSKK